MGWLGLLVVGALAAAGGGRESACVRAVERGSGVTELPAAWDLHLVGVTYMPGGRSMAVVRFGKDRNAVSNVYSAGERVWGRLEVLSIGRYSVLVRVDGKLHILKLPNRTTRDWNAFVATELPACPGS